MFGFSIVAVTSMPCYSHPGSDMANTSDQSIRIGDGKEAQIVQHAIKDLKWVNHNVYMQMYHNVTGYTLTVNENRK